MSFYRSCTGRKCESSENRGFVSLDTAGKGEEFPDSGGTHVLPHVIQTVVARLQSIEREMTAVAPALPKVRLRTPSGQWVLLYASRLSRWEEPGQVVVMFEYAHPMEIAPLIMQAYHLTRREGEVTP